MNKTILITGAAKRIGKEIALTYSDLGWNIIIHYNSSKKEAEELAKKINSKNMGILICGSGIGMSIASNRFKNVRSALVNSSTLSKLSRKHNNANIICLAARFVSKKVAIQCILSILTTKFEAGRHLRRVKLLS